MTIAQALFGGARRSFADGATEFFAPIRALTRFFARAAARIGEASTDFLMRSAVLCTRDLPAPRSDIARSIERLLSQMALPAAGPRSDIERWRELSDLARRHHQPDIAAWNTETLLKDWLDYHREMASSSELGLSLHFEFNQVRPDVMVRADKTRLMWCMEAILMSFAKDEHWRWSGRRDVTVRISRLQSMSDVVIMLEGPPLRGETRLHHREAEDVQRSSSMLLGTGAGSIAVEQNRFYIRLQRA